MYLRRIWLVARRVPYLLNKPPVVPNIGIAMGNVEVRFSVGLVIFVSAAAPISFCAPLQRLRGYGDTRGAGIGARSQKRRVLGRGLDLSLISSSPRMRFNFLKKHQQFLCGWVAEKPAALLLAGVQNSSPSTLWESRPFPYLLFRCIYRNVTSGRYFTLALFSRILPLSRSVRFQLTAAKNHWYHLSRALRYWKPCELQHIGEYILDFVPSTKFLLELIRSQSVAVSEAPFHSHFLGAYYFFLFFFSFFIYYFGWCVTQKQQFWSCRAYPSPLPR